MSFLFANLSIGFADSVYFNNELECCDASITSSKYARTITINPVEKLGVINNPGIGYVDFHGNLGERGKVDTTYTPDSKIAYYRWTWADLEPIEGDIKYEIIAKALEMAIEKNELFSFRIMTAWQNSTPRWLIKKGVGSVEGVDNQGTIFPDHNNTIYLEYHKRFIEKIGLFFKSNPFLYSVDIGSIGCWGEWHVSCCKESLRSQCQSLFPSVKSQREIAKVYFESFAKVNLIALINAPIFKELIEHGAGWRADCLGDYGYFSATSNHMDNVYAQALKDPVISSAWKHAPVIFEACFSIEDWREKGFSSKNIFNKALDWHATSINNFSYGVTSLDEGELKQFLGNIGFRFLVKKITYPYILGRAEYFKINTEWLNNGVAPIYSDSQVYFRLRKNNSIIAVWKSLASPRKWLPGNYFVNDTYEVEKNIEAGEYYLDVAISLIDNGGANLKLAMSGRLQDGWYEIGSMFIQ